MKLGTIILSLSIIVGNTLARSISTEKRDGVNEECKFVNSLLKEKEDYDCCKNTKITCENNYITKIALTQFDIKNKTLPSSVGATMPMLKILLLNDCNLEGSIPSDIGLLANIEEMELANNKLTGPIPDSIGSLKKLTRLILNSNKLSGPIPSTIGDLESISLLWLQDNQLTSIPKKIGGLTTLRILNLSYNKLTGTIPNTITGMTNLMQIEIQNNLGLKGKVPDLKDLKYINKCDYRNTNVCYDEDEKNSKCNYPANNYICKSCKENATLVGDICQCDSGYLGEGYIECYNDCKFVNSLLGKQETDDCCSYDPNKIKCSSSNRVTEINLEKDDIKVSILPSTIGSVPYLEKISMSNCNLGGSIPSDIGQITTLKELILDNNAIANTIPDISGLTQLQKLILSNNKLSGSIPNDIGKLTQLQTLDLSNNELKETIPADILNLYNTLSTLNLSDNELSGDIPTDIGNLSKLQTLDLSDNELTGNIPSSLSSIAYYLKKLNLGDNQLVGDISVVGQLTNLEYLNLSDNKFNGTIPTSIGNLSKLKTLILSDNEFSDKVPTQELEKLNFLNEIDLSENKDLYGKILNTKNLGELKSCNFKDTQLCIPKDNADSRCTYTEANYDCKVCKENATEDANGICQCNDKYTGIGYIGCTRIPGTEEEPKSGSVTDNDLNKESSSAFDTFAPRNCKYIFKFVNVLLTLVVMGKLFM